MKITDRVGEKYITNEGYTIEIIECFGCMNCTIRFENGVTIKNKRYDHIKGGVIKNPYHKSVYGVGCFGIGGYSKKNYPKIYDTWKGMLERCHDSKYQEKRPTYIGCLVAKEWYNFQIFAEWFEVNYKKSSVLDKDILIKGNKIYSAKTCCFVPQEINGLFIKRDAKRGKYPIGVCKEGSKFRAQMNINGKLIYLGVFNTPEEAFHVYKTAKEKQIKEVADKWKHFIKPKVYQVMYNYKVEITD